MPNMNAASIAIVALVSLALLLSGCAGNTVPQEKYDELAASCAKSKNDSLLALSREAAKVNAANAQLSACMQEKQTAQSLAFLYGQENVELEAKADVLDAARALMGRAAQYNLALEYYLDAFGPGKVPNNARLKKIDAQLEVVGDAALSALISKVKNCQGITSCSDAKAAVQPYVESQGLKLALEAAAVVGTGSQ